MEQFESFKASRLYCRKCAKSMPVRERLLLILARGNSYAHIIFIGTGEIGLPAPGSVANQVGRASCARGCHAAGSSRWAASSSSPRVPSRRRRFKLHLKIFQPEKIGAAASIAQLKYLKPDLIVVAAYGQILTKEVLNLPKHGCLNIHTSFLPKYRGASPIHSAIAAGEKQSGVTIMWMDEGLDTGDILLQEPVTLRRRETSETLHDRLAKLGADGLLKAIDMIEAGTAPRIKQDKFAGDVDQEVEEGRRPYQLGPPADGNRLRIFAR